LVDFERCKKDFTYFFDKISSRTIVKPKTKNKSTKISPTTKKHTKTRHQPTKPRLTNKHNPQQTNNSYKYHLIIQSTNHQNINYL